MSVRLGLDDARGWRVLRWLGRLLTVAAVWPAWYACFGEPRFDADAGFVGGTGLVLGGLLWLWSGYRTRNPLKVLEIDRAGGVARLREGPVAVAVTPLAELAHWTFRSWVVTTRTKHGTTSSTWYAARCAGFGDLDLYVDDNEADCQRFVHRVKAAAFPFDSKSWGFSEPVLDAVMKRHGLADRDAVLWAASWGDDGKRYLNEAELEAAARDLAETTVAARLAAGLDRQVAHLRGRPGRVLLAGLTLGLGAWVGWVATTREHTGAAIPVALGAFLLALGWRALGHPLIAVLVCLGAGTALASKPWVAPIMHTWNGDTQPFSPSSETHLYFAVPGVALGAVALIFALGLRVRRRT